MSKVYSGQIKMRPVTVYLNSKRVYNHDIDDNQQNPYASMYQQAFGTSKNAASKDKLIKIQDKYKFETPDKKSRERYTNTLDGRRADGGARLKNKLSSYHKVSNSISRNQDT